MKKINEKLRVTCPYCGSLIEKDGPEFFPCKGNSYTYSVHCDKCNKNLGTINLIGEQ
jgi:C4-type Zn-finger protein